LIFYKKNYQTLI